MLKYLKNEDGTTASALQTAEPLRGIFEKITLVKSPHGATEIHKG